MGYIDEVLRPGEKIRFTTSISWTLFLPPAGLLVLAAILPALFPTRSEAFLLAVPLAGLAFGIGAIWLVRAFLRRLTTEIAITDRRIIFKRGFIRRRTVEMNVDKIESIDVNQSVLGRIFDYGDITIRGTGISVEPFREIEAPLDFRSKVTAG